MGGRRSVVKQVALHAKSRVHPTGPSVSAYAGRVGGGLVAGVDLGNL